MRVLLSIKPEFATKIFDGSKQYEYSRIIFKNKNVNKVVVYESSPTSLIIGEFEIDGIIDDELPALWEQTKSHAGISQTKFSEYFADKSRGYAIKVKTPRRYERPVPLSSVTAAAPPQSFAYLV